MTDENRKADPQPGLEALVADVVKLCNLATLIERGGQGCTAHAVLDFTRLQQNVFERIRDLYAAKASQQGLSDAEYERMFYMEWDRYRQSSNYDANNQDEFRGFEYAWKKLRAIESAMQPAQPESKDAQMYQWLRPRFVGYDFEWGDPAKSVAVFEVGDGFRGGRDITAAIDADIQAKVRVARHDDS